MKTQAWIVDDFGQTAQWQDVDVDATNKVVVRIRHTAMNYKDALAFTSKGRIARTFLLFRR